MTYRYASPYREAGIKATLTVGTKKPSKKKVKQDSKFGVIADSGFLTKKDNMDIYIKRDE